jgi:glutamate--cysteine ligase
MGRLGYLSEAQDSLSVSYNDLASYTASLYDALTKPYPPYEAIGVRDGDEYRQLATSLLQIENEFYSSVRPKRVIFPGERPLHALRQRGVQYVEVRAMDLDPFSVIGISAQTIRFLDVFLLHCLLTDSPRDTPQEIQGITRNKQQVAARGREPGLLLDRSGKPIALRQWAGQVLAECEPIAAALDAAQSHGGSAHREALDAAVRALDDPASLPSARMLGAMEQRDDKSYFRFVMAQSLMHRRALQSEHLPDEVEARFAQMAQESIEAQDRIEAADDMTFEQYRQHYLSPERLGVG